MTTTLRFICGFIFGLGLMLGGMTNPAKVLNFLDIAAIENGTWDPSLIFVMIGGIGVTFTGYHFILKRPSPLFESTFHLPSKKEIDARLISGAAIFGIGWGMAGLCPGPALSSLGFGTQASLFFVVPMLIGMAMARFISYLLEKRI
jgi:hypothetical protein